MRPPTDESHDGLLESKRLHYLAGLDPDTLTDTQATAAANELQALQERQRLSRCACGRKTRYIITEPDGTRTPRCRRHGTPLYRQHHEPMAIPKGRQR